MQKREFKPRILGKQVWCSDCIDGEPSSIKKADFLVLKREGHYCLLEDESNIDNRVIGICEECLKKKSKFQQDNKQKVNVDHPHLFLNNR